jgi:hypothetical protein
MSEFTIKVTYGEKEYELRAVIESVSGLLMRIRVYGNRQSILLENDFPSLPAGHQSVKPIQWNIRSGGFQGKNRIRDAQLMADILSKLEEKIRDGMDHG